LTPELRELYGRFRLGPVDLMLGQQIVSWAVSDFASPMDLLNPYDYRRVVDQELPWSRLGTLMARGVVYAGPVQIEAAYLPLFTPARYDIVGGDWALLGQEFPLGALVGQLRASDSWRQLERFVAHWVPGWQDDLADIVNRPEYYADHTDVPDQDFTAPEAAARVKYTSAAIDLSAAYYYLWDDLPTLHVRPALRDLYDAVRDDPDLAATVPPTGSPASDGPDDPFALTHHRVQTVGLGLASHIEDVSLRAEGVMDFGRYTYREDLSAVQRNQARWVLNVDYTFAHDVFLEGLLIQAYLLDHEDDFLQREWTHIGGFVLRASFLDERLKLETLGLLDFSALDNDDWRRFDIVAGGWTLIPILTYQPLDPVKVSLGANFFGGRDDTLLGYLEGNSRVFALLRYGF
jgi:hypothetical protein